MGLSNALWGQSTKHVLFLAGLLAALAVGLTWQPLHAGAPIREERASLSARAHHGAKSGATRLSAGLIEGRVLLQGRTRHAGVQILLDGHRVATSDEAGRFVLRDVTPGPHVLTAQMPGYLSAMQEDVTVPAGGSISLAESPVTLLAGDVNGDDRINVFDMAIVVSEFRVASAERADLNDDGVVNLLDLVLASGNYGQVAPLSWGGVAELVLAASNVHTTPAPAPPLALSAPQPTPECLVQPTALHLRAGPGTAYPVLGALPGGTVLHPQKRNPSGDWLLVSVPDPDRGWVAARYLTCNVALEVLEVERELPPLETTPAPAGPVLTPTPYPVPVLLDPPDGHSFVGEVTLSWTWSGQLGPDEHFDVQVWRLGEKPRGVAWSDTGTWTGRLYGGDGPYQWRIVVIRGRDGRWEADLSRPSQIRFFNYYRLEPPREKKIPAPITPTVTPFWPPTLPPVPETPVATATPSATPPAFTATPSGISSPTSTGAPPTGTPTYTSTPASPTPTTTEPVPPTTTPSITPYPPPPSPTATAYPPPLQVSRPTPTSVVSSQESGPLPQPAPTPQNLPLTSDIAPPFFAEGSAIRQSLF